MKIQKIKDWIKSRDDRSDIFYMIENSIRGYVECGTLNPYPKLIWTKDFKKAVKFRDKEKAVKCTRLYGPYTDYKLKITEHVYM